MHCADLKEVSMPMNMGRRYVKVFPEPVSARAITLLFLRISGIVFICTSVGSLTDCFSKAEISISDIPRSLKFLFIKIFLPY